MLLFLFLSFILHLSKGTQYTLDDCGKSIGCTVYPDGCTQSCSMYAMYGVDTADSSYLYIQIGGKASAGHYIAMGISTASGMGPAAVLACLNNGGIPKMEPSSNTKSHTNDPVNPTATFLKMYNMSALNGEIVCEGKRLLKPVGTDAEKLFDLTSRKYHILLATGPVNNDNIRIDQHPGQPVISSDTVNLTGNQNQQTSPPDTLTEKLVKAHGILMVIGWWVCITTGIMFARHFKEFMENKKYCGTALWFTMHRIINTIGLVCILSAFFTIFYATKWTWVGNSPNTDLSNHAICGVSAVIFAFTQPVFALIRPGPKSARRPLFNIVHRTLGIFSWILAFACIWLAGKFHLALTPQGDHQNQPRIAMFLFLGFTVLADIILRVTTETYGSDEHEVRRLSGRLFGLRIGVFIALMAQILNFSIQLCVFIGTG